MGVKLVPLKSDHKAALLSAASDGNLWDLWYTSVPSANSIDEYLEKAKHQLQAHLAIPFAVVDEKHNKIVGSTRYCNIDERNRRFEIGYTWYAKSYQRTGTNTVCKYLLLQQAFEKFNCIAVEFRTHWHNHPSRNAILRLGAKQDGVLRNHRICSDGSLRDTVVYSIIKSEWPTVKRSLEAKLKHYY